MNENVKISTNRELITTLLAELHPEADLNDEEILFGIIYDDYSSYADLIMNREEELAKAHAEGEVKGRNAAIEDLIEQEPPTDGIPDLGGANTTYHQSQMSIFDIAKQTQ